jgi:hypothetical protein
MNHPSLPWRRTSDAGCSDLFARYCREFESWHRVRTQALPDRPTPGHPARLSAIDAYNAYMRVAFPPEQQSLISPDSDWLFRP